MSRLILGINSEHADSSAALVSDRGLVAAIAEERINRKKHCAGFPRLAVAEVLRLAGATLRDVTDIAVARDPRANLTAKAAFVAQNPMTAIPRALDRLAVHRGVAKASDMVAEALGAPAGHVGAAFHQVEHHVAHAASAFFCSPFERATAFTVDGAGDFATSLVARGEGTSLQAIRRTMWPHSAGVFYTALCQLIGFDRFGEEYKVMGLSSYGVNRFAREMRRLVSYERGRGFRLDLRYFQHHQASRGLEWISEDGAEVTVPRLFSTALEELLGPARPRSEPIGERERDIAASMQIRFEEIYLEAIADAVDEIGSRDVVLAGGCALNSVANGRMLTERVADRAYFHPAASDDGTAAGAALHVAHVVHQMPRSEPLAHAYLGTEWSDEEIEAALRESGLPYERLSRDALIGKAVDALSQGAITGWFQGREEWGPRALGNRSILCHPGWPGMKATLNARIKNREPFRPFAPVILAERVSECFHGTHESPFMIVVYRVRSEWKERLAAITHEDGTGRVQTVTRNQNALYYDLIRAFGERTGIPVLLNTSFNENEPIVHTPKQAIDCFARTRMEKLGIGSFWLEKPNA